MKKTVLIMAGGRGERFWPKSRRNLPKQFLSLTDDGVTMIQHTVNRILPLVDVNDIFISTNEEYIGLVREQLANIPKENILCEPVSKNTAPCIALAAGHIQHKYDDAVMIVLPSDHLIKNNEMFLYTLKDAIEVAQSDANLVTIGITPTHPEVGYGYIKFSNKRASFGESTAFKVEKFVEKPNLEKAKEYLSCGTYLWNSGMFVWKVSSIMENFKANLPSIYAGVNAILAAKSAGNYEKVLQEKFGEFESVSIDYGILEKAENIFVLPATFGWDDVGSWLALERLYKTDDCNNVISGNIITIDTQNSIIQGSEKLIALVGVEDLIVVDTQDATLICNKSDANKIKKVLENLKICNRKEYI